MCMVTPKTIDKKTTFGGKIHIVKINVMFDDIIAAIPFGIILAFTIGPVFFVLLETSATKGFKAAIVFDLGVVLADIIFVTVAFLVQVNL